MHKFSNGRQRKATQTVRRIRYTRIITQSQHGLYKAGKLAIHSHKFPVLTAVLVVLSSYVITFVKALRKKMWETMGCIDYTRSA